MKTHIGAYGLIINNNKILLIKKKGGPYDGKLDLPGGTIEFYETPEETLIRELKEEVGISIIKYSLFDSNSVNVVHNYKDQLINIHHIGIFYKVEEFSGNIKENIKIDDINDDSMGAKFYEINKLKKDKLSSIAIIELEKLGYKL